LERVKGMMMGQIPRNMLAVKFK